jgi:hypothetical protein
MPSGVAHWLHSRCTIGFWNASVNCLANRVFQGPHGGNGVLCNGFDVAPVRGADIGVPQDLLNHLVRYAQPIEVRGKPPTETVPSIPGQTSRGQCRTDNIEGELFEIDRRAGRARGATSSRRSTLHLCCSPELVTLCRTNVLTDVIDSMWVRWHRRCLVMRGTTDISSKRSFRTGLPRWSWP